MKHLLEFDGVTLFRNGREVLKDVYMKCETGQLVGLLGRNGSGKSTLFQWVFGSLTANTGLVRIDGKPYRPSGTPAIHYLPQQALFPSFVKVKQALELFRLSTASFQERFPVFEQKLNLRYGELSGGERRLVDLYGVLKTPGKFCLLDEPFSYLSPLVNEQVMALMQEVREHKGLIITDHAYRYLLDHCSPLYKLEQGAIREIRSTQQLQGYLPV